MANNKPNAVIVVVGVVCALLLPLLLCDVRGASALTITRHKPRVVTQPRNVLGIHHHHTANHNNNNNNNKKHSNSENDSSNNANADADKLLNAEVGVDVGDAEVGVDVGDAEVGKNVIKHAAAKHKAKRISSTLTASSKKHQFDESKDETKIASEIEKAGDAGVVGQQARQRGAESEGQQQHHHGGVDFVLEDGLWDNRLEENVGKGLPGWGFDGAPKLPYETADNADPSKLENDVTANTLRDATLRDLITSAGRPLLDRTTSSYHLTVEGVVTSVSLTAVASCKNAAISVAGVVAKSGSATLLPPLTRVTNEFDVVVTARDKTTTHTYRVEIVRELGRMLVSPVSALGVPNEKPASTLGSLSTSLCQLQYNPNTFVWEGEASRASEIISIFATPTTPNAIISVIDGTNVLPVDNGKTRKFPTRETVMRLKVLVTAPDKTSTKTYFVAVTPKLESRVPEDCLNGCSDHGECNRASRMCICQAGWVRPDCSASVGPDAFEISPEDDEMTTPSLKENAYGLRFCEAETLRLPANFVPNNSTIPEECAGAVILCRRVMGELLKNQGTIHGRCVEHVSKCLIAEDFSSCYFSVVIPKSDHSSLFAIEVVSGHVNNYIAPLHRIFASVPSGTEQVTLKAVASLGASIAVNNLPVDTNGFAVPFLALPGPNKVDIVVTAENGITITSYTIVVMRETTVSSENSPNIPPPVLTNLRVTHANIQPAFALNRHFYHVDLASTFDSIHVIPELDVEKHPEYDGYTVSVNGNAVTPGTVSQNILLLPGSNRIVVGVTASDGQSSSTYTIIVQKERVKMSDETDSNLRSLETLNILHVLSPPFQNDVLSYKLKVPDASGMVLFRATPRHTLATLAIDGTAVENGHVCEPILVNPGVTDVSVIVTAPNAVDSTTYRISIVKELPLGTKSNRQLPAVTGIFGDGGLLLDQQFRPHKTDYIMMVPANEDWAVLYFTGQSGVFLSVAHETIRPFQYSRPIRLKKISTQVECSVIDSRNPLSETTYLITIMKDHSELMMLRKITPSIGRLRPPFRSNVFQYLLLLPVAESQQTVSFVPEYDSTAATVMINDAKVLDGQQSSDIDIHSGKVGITLMPRDTVLESLLFTITFQQVEVAAAATTDFSKNLALYGKVPDSVDKTEYCRLDQCHQDIVASDSGTLPPSCNPAVGDSVASGSDLLSSLAVTSSPNWKAHLQCPATAGCNSLSECSKLVRDCVAGPTAFVGDSEVALKKWYRRTLEAFRIMDVDASGKLSKQELHTGLQNLAPNMDSRKFSKIESTTKDGLSVADFLTLSIQFEIQFSPLTQSQITSLKEILEQFRAWSCEDSSNTICEEKAISSLQSQGLTQAYGHHVVLEIRERSGGSLGFESFLEAVFTGVVPLSHILPLVQEHFGHVIREVSESLQKFASNHNSGLTFEEFQKLLQKQLRSASASTDDIHALFEACSVNNRATFSELLNCARGGLLPLDSLEASEYGHYLQILEIFLRLDHKAVGSISVNELTTFVSEFDLFHPPTELELEFSNFISHFGDLDHDGSISRAEFFKLTANRMFPPPQAKYAWLRLFEIWALLRSKLSNSVDVNVLAEHLQARMNIPASSATFFAGLMIDPETKRLNFREAVQILDYGIGSHFAEPFQPQYTSRDVIDAVTSLLPSAKSNVRELIARLLPFGFSPSLSRAVAGMVINNGNFRKISVDDENTEEVSHSQLVAAHVQGYVPTHKNNAAIFPVFMDILEDLVVQGNVSPDIPASQFHSLITQRAKSINLDATSIDQLTRALDPTNQGVISAGNAIRFFISASTFRWGRIGSLEPSLMSGMVFRWIVNVLNKAQLTTQVDVYFKALHMSETHIQNVKRLFYATATAASPISAATFVEHIRECGIPLSSFDAPLCARTLAATMSAVGTDEYQVAAVVKNVLSKPPNAQREAIVLDYLRTIGRASKITVQGATIAALAGVLPLEFPSYGLADVEQTIKTAWNQRTISIATPVTVTDISRGLEMQGMSGVQAMDIAQIVTSQPYVTLQSFSKAVLKGIIPLGFAFPVTTVEASSTISRSISSNAETISLTLGAIQNLRPSSSGAVPRDRIKNMLQSNGFSADQQQLISRAIDIDGHSEIPLLECFYPFSKGLLTDPNGKIAEAFWMQQQLSNAETGIPKSKFEELLKTLGVDRNAAKLISASIAPASSNDLQNSHLIAGVLSGLVPLVRENVPEGLPVTCATVAWNEISQGGRPGEVVPMTHVSKWLESRTFSKQDAATITQVFTRAGHVSFEDFFQTLREQNIPIDLEGDVSTPRYAFLHQMQSMTQQNDAQFALKNTPDFVSAGLTWLGAESSKAKAVTSLFNAVKNKNSLFEIMDLVFQGALPDLRFATATTTNLADADSAVTLLEIQNDQNDGAVKILRACESSTECPSQLKSAFGFTDREVSFFANDERSSAAVALCALNSRSWDCRSVLAAFESYLELPTHTHISTSYLELVLSGMHFQSGDASLVANLVDFDHNGHVSLSEFLAAWNQNILPAYSGAGSAATIQARIQNSRNLYSSLSFSTVPSLYDLLVASLPSSDPNVLEHSDDAMALLNEWAKYLSRRFQTTKHTDEQTLTNIPDVVFSEDDYVRMVLLGVVPTPISRNSRASSSRTDSIPVATNPGLAAIVREFLFYTDGGETVSKANFAVKLSALGIPEHSRVILAEAVANDPLNTALGFVSFPAFLKFVMRGAIALRTESSAVDSDTFGYASGLDSRTDEKWMLFAPLHVFTHCYFHRKSGVSDTEVNHEIPQVLVPDNSNQKIPQETIDDSSQLSDEQSSSPQHQQTNQNPQLEEQNAGYDLRTFDPNYVEE